VYLFPPRERNSRGDPPRTQHQVGVTQRVEHRGQLLGLVGAVSVHLDQHGVAALQAPGEASHVRGGQALLAQAVQHVDVIVGCREPVRDRPCAVRRVVISDEDVGLRNGGTHPRGDALDVLHLVVRRDDHQDPAQVGELLSHRPIVPCAPRTGVSKPTSGRRRAGPGRPADGQPRRALRRRRRRITPRPNHTMAPTTATMIV
jgi:hypothetical protein